MYYQIQKQNIKYCHSQLPDTKIVWTIRINHVHQPCACSLGNYQVINELVGVGRSFDPGDILKHTLNQDQCQV